MSRTGKAPITMPAGVTGSVKDGVVFVQGPQGKLEHKLGLGVSVVFKGNVVEVTRLSDEPQPKANHGTTRALLNNMVSGVAKGWKKTLEMTGVGYNATLSGQILKLNCGLSHEVKFDLPKEIKCKVEKTTIHLESADRQLLGNVASKIRAVRPPEPYLGKGIRYSDEKIRRKAGKTGKK